MQNLLDDLKQLLQQDERCVAKGQLLKNKVIELALSTDAVLIKLLLKNKNIKNHFFTNVDGILVFDKIKFQHFISNKEFLPDSYTAFKNKIGLVNENGEYLSESREVVLVWPYRDCILEGGQTKEDQKRDEIFWNETLAPDEIDKLLAPKVLTTFKRYDNKGEHIITSKDNIDFTKENLIIRGNNLLALKSLQKEYVGKVKLIYIDPPYNTDNDSFLYNDSFTQSTWLTFIKNRLEVAKALLAKDGSIFIQISDINIAPLKMLMNDIFGYNNFVNQISIETRSPSGFKTVNLGVFESAEYILIYAKDKNLVRYNRIYIAGKYDEQYRFFIKNKNQHYEKWQIESIRDKVANNLGFKNSREAKDKLSESAFENAISEFALTNHESVFRLETIGDDAGKETVKIREISKKNPLTIYFLSRDNHEDRYIYQGQEIAFYSRKIKVIDGKTLPSTMLTNIWTDISWEGIAKEGNVTLRKGKKPEKLLRRIIEIATEKNDIVMDYFVGSGTTCAVAHKMGRQYIGIEQLEYGENDCVQRIRNVISGDSSGVSKIVNWQGGGSFVYCELMKWNEMYISQIENAKTIKELIDLWKEMQSKAFINYKVEPKSINDNISNFNELSFYDLKRFLIEILDKNQLYVNYSEIDDVEYKISETNKKLNRRFYDWM